MGAFRRTINLIIALVLFAMGCGGLAYFYLIAATRNAGTFATSSALLLVTAYRRGIAFGDYSNDRLVHNILFCIGCRQFRRPHSKPPRNACAGHCLLLRARHRHRRQHFAPVVRLADRIRIALAREFRICNRRVAAPRGGD
jgi:hypothetical protein